MIYFYMLYIFYNEDILYMSRRKKITRKKQVINKKNVIDAQENFGDVRNNIFKAEEFQEEKDNKEYKNHGKEKFDVNATESSDFQKNIRTVNPVCSFAILFMFVGISFFSINHFILVSTFKFVIGYKILVSFVCLYYLVVYFLNRKMDNIISLCFLNFMRVVVIYNILMHFNWFKIPLLSQTYFVSNILYFYVSFLMASYSYKIYDFFSFLGSYLLSLIEGLTKSMLKFFVLILIPYFVISYVIIWIGVHSQNSNISLYYDKIFWISIFVIMFFAVFCKYNVGFLNKIHIKTVYFESKYKLKEKIDEKTEYILNFFKMSRIPDLKLINEDKKLLIPSSIFYIVVKIIVPLWILMFYSAGFQYFYYYETNNNYCTNLDYNTGIIKLYNGNVILSDSNFLKEVNCEKEKISIEISIAKLAEKMLKEPKAH